MSCESGEADALICFMKAETLTLAGSALPALDAARTSKYIIKPKRNKTLPSVYIYNKKKGR